MVTILNAPPLTHSVLATSLLTGDGFEILPVTNRFLTLRVEHLVHSDISSQSYTDPTDDLPWW